MRSVSFPESHPFPTPKLLERPEYHQPQPQKSKVGIACLAPENAGILDATIEWATSAKDLLRNAMQHFRSLHRLRKITPYLSEVKHRKCAHMACFESLSQHEKVFIVMKQKFNILSSAWGLYVHEAPWRSISRHNNGLSHPHHSGLKLSSQLEVLATTASKDSSFRYCY